MSVLNHEGETSFHRILSGVIVGSLLLWTLVAAMSAREIPASTASCAAAHGVEVFDHDGHRCMRDGRAIDPNDEVTP